MAPMMRFLRSYIADSRGVAAIEMAFIMPFLLFLYFGLVDLTALISTTRKINYTASVVGDLVTQNDTTINKATISDYYNAAAMVMAPTPMANIRIEVYQYRKVQGVPTNMWNNNNGGSGSCGAPSILGMLNLMTDNNDLIVTEVCTTYSPYIASFLGSQILGATSFSLADSIALRPRQSNTLTCSDC
jgi:Flp pilus assembly protein TadG